MYNNKSDHCHTKRKAQGTNFLQNITDQCKVLCIYAKKI